MSVRTVQGDILDAEENIIVHQVNCKGTMGGGLAKQIKEKWPEVYEVYKTYCSNEPTLGYVQWCKIGDEQWVLNLFGQYGYGRHAGKVYTNYEALEKGLRSVFNNADWFNLTVAIPYGIGCGLGGGDWEGIVLPMILDIFEKSEIEVKIYKKL